MVSFLRELGVIGGCIVGLALAYAGRETRTALWIGLGVGIVLFLLAFGIEQEVRNTRKAKPTPLTPGEEKRVAEFVRQGNDTLARVLSDPLPTHTAMTKPPPIGQAIAAKLSERRTYHEIGDRNVVLRVVAGSPLEPLKVTCKVTDPIGGITSALVWTQQPSMFQGVVFGFFGQHRAEAIYPDDFAHARPLTVGGYKVEWSIPQPFSVLGEPSREKDSFEIAESDLARVHEMRAVEILKEHYTEHANVKIMVFPSASLGVARSINALFELAGWPINFNETPQEPWNTTYVEGVEVKGTNRILVEAVVRALEAARIYDIHATIMENRIGPENAKYPTVIESIRIVVGHLKAS